MKEVLFVCTGNYYRSRYSEIVFNHHARMRGLDWMASSRGFRLSPRNPGPLSRRTIDGLAMRGIHDPTMEREPLQVNRGDFQRADLIVALKEEEHRPFISEGFCDFSSRVVYWNVHDVEPSASYDPLSEMDKAVMALLDQLGRGMDEGMRG